MSKNAPLTSEEKKEIIKFKLQGYNINDIARHTKHSTTTVYQVIRASGIAEEKSIGKDPLMVTPEDIEKFKETVHVGDKYRVYREVTDIYGFTKNEFVTETVKGIYPHIVDCTKGSYRYVQLMHCKKVYDGE